MKLPLLPLLVGAMGLALLAAVLIIHSAGVDEPAGFAGGVVGGVLAVFAVLWWKRRRDARPPR